MIRQEDTAERDGTVALRAAVESGENIRPAGEVLLAGSTVLRAGTRLGAAELGAAVTAGAGELSVGRRPRVQVLSTGDELVEPGAALLPGEIHNSNAPMLNGLAAHAGATCAAPGRLPDDRSATESGLAEALEHSDVVIVSGGVSVGPHDHVKPALATLGVQEIFWRVALQPGKPTWFGSQRRQARVRAAGKPGVGGRHLRAVRRAGARRAPGSRAINPPSITRSWRRRCDGIRTATRRSGCGSQTRGGALTAVPNGPQGSHMITSLLGADALALIPAGEGELPAGTLVALTPLPR